MLIRVAINGVLEQIAADSAVVEQCVALAGAPVTNHSLTLGVAIKQETQQIVADCLGPPPQLQGHHLVQPGLLFDARHVVDPAAGPPRTVPKHESNHRAWQRPTTVRWRGRASL